MKMVVCGAPENKGRRMVMDKCKAFASSGRGDGFIYVVPNNHLLALLREEFLKSPGISGIVDDSFVLFEGLCRILADRFRIRRKTIGNIGRNIVMKRVLHSLADQNELEVFSPLITSEGFLQDMLELVSAFKSSNTRPEDFKSAFDGYEMTSKDRDISRIYEAFQNELKTFGVIEQADLALIVLDNLKSCKNLQEVLKGIEFLVFDGFFDFSPVERGIIQELRKCVENIFICLEADPQRLELFDSVIDLAKSFEGFSVQYYDKNEEDSSRTLEHVQRHLFSSKPPKFPNDGSIYVRSYPTIHWELREAARKAKKMIQQGICSIHDICFAVRDVGMYRPIIVRVFEEFGLPLMLTDFRKLSQTCTGRAVYNMLGIAMDWDYSNMAQLIKSGYVEFGESINVNALREILINTGTKTDRKVWDGILDKYVFDLKASFGTDMTQFEQDVCERIRHEIEEVEKACTNLKRIFDILESFNSFGTLSYYANTLLETLEELEFEEIAKNHVKNYIDTSYTEMKQDELRSYVQIRKILQEIKVCGNVFQSPEILLADFAVMIMQLLQETSVEGQRASDDGIRVISTTELRLSKYHTVFLLGLGEGIFPALISEDWIYPDTERERLALSGIRLETAKERRKKEKLFFYAAVSCALECLYVSYPKRGISDVVLPSQYFEELINLFENDAENETDTFGSSVLPCSLDQFGSRNELILSLVDFFWSLQAKEDFDVERALALYGFAASCDPEFFSRMTYLINIEAIRDGVTFSEWDGWIFNENIIRDLKEGFENKIYSVTELESFAQCPFMYYASRVLKLGELPSDDYELSNLDRGEMYHQILKEFFESNKGERLLPEKIGVYREILTAITDKVFSKIEESLLILHKGLLSVEKKVMLQTVWQLIEGEIQANEKADTYLYPTYFEVGFGLKGEQGIKDGMGIREPFRMQVGDEVVRLWGKIDRIDLDSQGRFLVYDYKKSKVHSFSDIEAGRALQIAVYIMAADELLFKGERECLGGAYYFINTLDRNSGLWKKRYAGITRISTRTNSNLEDSEFEQMMEKTKVYIAEYVRQMKNGGFMIDPSSQCPSYCAFMRICRYDKRRIQRKREPDLYGYALEAREIAGSLEGGADTSWNTPENRKKP